MAARHFKRSTCDPNRYPDPDGRAAIVERFFASFKLWDGRLAGRPVAVYPYMQAILRGIYGRSLSDGSRAVREACLWLPRGNAKTTLASLLALLHLYVERAGKHSFTEPGAQVLLAAADREQASICYQSAWHFAEAHPVVSQFMKFLPSVKTIKNTKTLGSLKALSRESKTKHGLSANCAIMDEIHAWGPQGDDLHRTIVDSFAKRAEPLVVNISTAGEGDGGVAYEKWEYSVAWQHGEIQDDRFFAFFAGASAAELKGTRWRQKRTWLAANPLMRAGALSSGELAAKLPQAIRVPANAAAFRRYHLNEWQDLESNPLFDMQQYDRGGRRRANLDGALCTIGIDMARVHDLASVSVVFPDLDQAGYFDVLNRCFTHSRGLEKRSQVDRARYSAWVREGYLQLAGREAIEDDAILKYIEGIAERYEVVQVLVDPYQAKNLMTYLDEHTGLDVVEHRQGAANLFPAVQLLWDVVSSGHLRHGGDPQLRFCFANCPWKTDMLGNYMLKKDNRNRRIDGAMSCAMAIGYWATEQGQRLINGSLMTDPDFDFEGALNDAYS